jgi:hypothetical protein
MSRYFLAAKLTLVLLALASLAVLIADAPWGPN